MVGIGSGIHIQIPDGSKKRILHPAKIVGLSENVYSAELDEEDLTLHEEQDVLIYFDQARTFVQQSARIKAVIDCGPVPMIEFTTTGQPASAENREFYRVSTVTSNLTATLGGDANCPVLDVSCTGFSVISRSRYDIGEHLEASIKYRDSEYSGCVCIQSIRELPSGSMRYGVHSLNEKGATNRLARGLQQMSVAIQQEQLRRMAAST